MCIGNIKPYTLKTVKPDIDIKVIRKMLVIVISVPQYTLIGFLRLQAGEIIHGHPPCSFYLLAKVFKLRNPTSHDVKAVKLVLPELVSALFIIIPDTAPDTVIIGHAVINTEQNSACLYRRNSFSLIIAVIFRVQQQVIIVGPLTKIFPARKRAVPVNPLFPKLLLNESFSELYVNRVRVLFPRPCEVRNIPVPPSFSFSAVSKKIAAICS